MIDADDLDKLREEVTNESSYVQSLPRGTNVTLGSIARSLANIASLLYLVINVFQHKESK